MLQSVVAISRLSTKAFLVSSICFSCPQDAQLVDNPTQSSARALLHSSSPNLGRRGLLGTALGRRSLWNSLGPEAFGTQTPRRT